MSLTTARDESILQHTNLLSLHLSPVEPAAAVSPSVVALQKQITAHLPSREWFRIPMQFEPTAAFVSHFSMQHGTALPTLSVRVLPNHVICDEARGRELDASLQWLMESIGVGSSYPVLGLDCESDCTPESDGEVRLLQMSTGTRCLLIRVPEQGALREVVGHAALEKQFATASTSGAQPPTATAAANPLFTPLFHSILSNKTIFKSGAELWTDALDLWACTGTGPVSGGPGVVTGSGVEMNSCLNMSWIYRNEHGGALSLAAMVNLSLGSERCFLKDKPTTTSDWGAKQLNLRQYVYAALDAQASFIAGANQSQIPKPFHVGDMPKTWLSVAASWKQVLRSNKMARESGRVGGVNNTFNRYDPAADALLDAATKLLCQTMQGEEPWHPFIASLLQIPFLQQQQAIQSMPPPNAHLIQSQRVNGMALSPTYFQGEDLAIETSNASTWWFSSAMEGVPLPGRKDESDLGQILDRSRITAVVGGTGAGKTTAAALEALRSLHKPSSIPFDHVPLDMRTTGQRVLLVTETEHAARAAAEQMAKFVSPQDAMVLLSSSTLTAWEQEPTSESSARARALVPLTDEEDRSILICSVDYALALSSGSSGDASVGQWRLHHRQTLLLDDASQVWLLKLVLLLRRLPHTERLILFGDERTYQARWGELIVDDALSAALAAARLTQPRCPQPFKVQKHRLQTQWRMAPHLAAGVSEIFYMGRLPLPATPSSPGQLTRAIGWVDVRTEDSMVLSVATLWTHYLSLGFRWDQLVVLCLSESTRLAIGGSVLFSHDKSFLSRIHTPETFQGRGAEVVLVILNPGVDKRRLLVACSRAAQKLFLIGDRQVLTNLSPAAATNSTVGDRSIQLLAEFEQREVDDVFNSSTSGPDANGITAAHSPDGVEETFSSIAVKTSAKSTPVKSALATDVTPAMSQSSSQPTASWGAGTLNFTKQTASASPSQEVATVAATDSRSSKKSAAQVLSDKSVSNAAPEKKATPAAPVPVSSTSSTSKSSTAVTGSNGAVSQDIEFQPAPENRAWKVLPCDKLHSVDGRRPSGTCHLGDKCGFLHSDFWIRRGAVGEFVLCTPGSNIAMVEVVEPWNDRRLRQMEQIVDSKLNRANRDRSQREFAHLFPEETPIVASDDMPPVLSQPKNNSTSKASTASKPTTAASIVSQPTAAQIVSSSTIDSEDLSRAAVGGRQKRGGRKKATLPQDIPGSSAAVEEESATSSAQAPNVGSSSSDDFVPVSRRHGKHSSVPLTEEYETEPVEESVPVGRNNNSVPSSSGATDSSATSKRKAKQQRAAAAQAAEEEAAAIAAQKAEDEAAAAAEEAAIAAAEEEERLAKKRSAEPLPAVDYPTDMIAGSWWLPDELAALSKNARKKLLWLCPACRAPNANGDAKCSLCSGSKPLTSNIRYAKPPGSLGPLPREVDGKYAYESEWVKLVVPPASNSSSSSSSVNGMTPLTGAPVFVAAKAIPAGTVILREDSFFSEVTGTGPKAALLPQPRSCAQLAAQLLNDPIQMALLRTKWNANPWSDAQIRLFLRNAEAASGVPSLKPKDPNVLKEWPMAMAFATTAKYAREDQEGHTMECKCHRFKLPRQSAVLVPSCWPNCAVTCLHADPMLTPDQMAILAVTDIPAGAVLTNVSDQALLNLPADRRQQTISLTKYRSTGRACHCERCVGKLAVEQEKLLLQEIPGWSVDKARMNTEYDKVMIAYSETQQSKLRVYKSMMIKDDQGRDVLAPPPTKDGVSEATYFALCYAFLTRAFDFLTTHPLHPCHWRMQKVRELYLSLVRCDFLYRMDYMTLSGLVAPEGQHATLRQIVHVLDAAIRSDQLFFREMEPMKSLPLLTLLELCTFLIQNKVTIRPSGRTAKDASGSGTSSGGGKHTYKVECLEFEGIGRFDSQAAFLLNLSQLNQYAAIIRTLNFPYRKP